MNAVAVRVSFDVIARTRDECIVKMDELGIDFLEATGGAPWIAHDDDITKHKAEAPLTLADDHGYVYEGKRTYIFGGPFLADLAMQQNDGFRVQKGVDDD